MESVLNISRDVEAGTRHATTEAKGLFGLEVIRRPAKDDPDISKAMASTDKVKVFQHKKFFGVGRSLFWGFEPQDNVQGVGFILYPGTLVDAKAYAPIARRMAENGFHAAIATPPLSISSVDTDLADEIVNYGPWKDSVKSWAISGHSQGGAIACAYAKDNQKSSLKGVVLLAAYPGDSKLLNGDISDSTLKVTSIYGTKDAFVDIETEIKGLKYLLPSTAKYVEIKGGNHTQFSYVADIQVSKGVTDGQPEISLTEQQEIICTEILSLLDDIKKE